MISESNKQTPFFKFENLRIYFKAVDFSNAILALSANSENTKYAHFMEDFFHTANEICLSVADGAAEPKSIFISKLNLTKSAIRKCVVYCSLASRNNLIDSEQENDIRNELMELTKMVGALITSLQKQDIIQDDNNNDI